MNSLVVVMPPAPHLTLQLCMGFGVDNKQAARAVANRVIRQLGKNKLRGMLFILVPLYGDWSFVEVANRCPKAGVRGMPRKEFTFAEGKRVVERFLARRYFSGSLFTLGGRDSCAAQPHQTIPNTFVYMRNRQLALLGEGEAYWLVTGVLS